jgi:ribosomal protein L13E
LQFLIERNGRGFSWEETERLGIDHEPLSEEILYRIKNAREEDYLTVEDARREYPGIQVNLP